MAKTYCNLTFNNFPFIWGVLKLSKSPDGVPYAVYRCGETDPTGVKVPRWFGDLHTAAMYAGRYKNIYRCHLKADLKLLDIRVMRYMLQEQMINEMEQLPDAELKCYKAKYKPVMISLGLTSHMEQYNAVLSVDESAKAYYSHFNENRPAPLTEFGSRLSYIVFDEVLVDYAKHIFYSLGIDGYIAPSLPLPKTTFHPEICLFDPKQAITHTDVFATNESVEDMELMADKENRLDNNISLATLINNNATRSSGCMHFGKHICIMQDLDTAVPMEVEGGANIKPEIATMYNRYWDDLNKKPAKIFAMPAPIKQISRPIVHCPLGSTTPFGAIHIQTQLGGKKTSHKKVPQKVILPKKDGSPSRQTRAKKEKVATTPSKARKARKATATPSKAGKATTNPSKAKNATTTPSKAKKVTTNPAKNKKVTIKAT